MLLIVCAGIDIKGKKSNLLNDWVNVTFMINLKAKLSKKDGKMPEIVSKFDLLTPKCQL